MLVISDTSPLNILVRIGRVDVLPALFGQVFVPPSVVEEMTHPSTPASVRDWMAAPPAWLRVQAPAHIDQSIPLDPGERAAICLARQLKADLLLLDDQKARRYAQHERLPITGTLGLLELASAQGLLSLPDTVQRLQATDFRLASHLLAQALERDAVRQQEQGRSIAPPPEQEH